MRFGQEPRLNDLAFVRRVGDRSEVQLGLSWCGLVTGYVAASCGRVSENRRARRGGAARPDVSSPSPYRSPCPVGADPESGRPAQTERSADRSTTARDHPTVLGSSSGQLIESGGARLGSGMEAAWFSL